MVADVKTVWAVGEVYERDMAHVPGGGGGGGCGRRRCQARACAGVFLTSIRESIPVTRTAKVRVEIANPRQELRFGMYVTMRLAVGSGRPVVLVPRAAVQPLGETSVAYLPLAGGEGRPVDARSCSAAPWGMQLRS